MRFFDQFFGSKKPKQSAEKSKYLPKEAESKEVLFAKKFIERGGKFIYCEDATATFSYFNQIIEENGWTADEIESNSPVLSSFFNLIPSEKKPKALVLHCEYLVANKGAVLICNRQIQEKKLSELPENLIIIAKTNDFKNDVSEAMTSINKKYKNNLPSNITTLNAFDPTKENDFLSYGGNANHLYLLVQEVN